MNTGLLVPKSAMVAPRPPIDENCLKRATVDVTSRGLESHRLREDDKERESG